MYRRILFIIILLSACGCFFIQKTIVKNYGFSMSEESLSYLPASEQIKPFLLGYKTAFANYLWIRTVIYYGHHAMGDSDFSWLVQMLDITTKLNPHFYPVYEFAGLILPEVTGNIDAARIILDRGIFYLGNKKYNLAFYMGMLHYRYYNDRRTAAQYFTLAAHSQSAPVEKLLRLAGSFLAKEVTDKQSIAMLAFLYETSENPEVRRYLAESIQKVYAQESATKKVSPMK